MLKLNNLKIIVLSIIFALFIGITTCYAVDLDLSDDDLTTNTDFSNSSNNIENNVNTSNTNTNSNTNSNSTTNSSDYNNTSFNSTNTSTNSTSSATVKNSLPESDLGLSNILNIFLIVIGVLLILLSIAILIRLKK